MFNDSIGRHTVQGVAGGFGSDSNEDQDFCLISVVALKRAVLNGSTKSRFKISLNFSYEDELTVYGRLDTKGSGFDTPLTIQ